DDLADDLRRFLDGRPILARRTSAWGRVVKWARRRPGVAVLVAALVALTAAGGGLAAGGAWEKGRGGGQRKRADQEEAMKQREELLKRTVQYARILDNAQRFGEPGTEHNRPHAITLLDGCPEELRHWEWRYLRHRYRGSQLTLVGHQRPVAGLA